MKVWTQRYFSTLLTAMMIGFGFSAAHADVSQVDREILVGLTSGPISISKGQGMFPEASVVDSNERLSALRLMVRPGDNVDAIIARLRLRPGVRYAERNQLKRVAATPDDAFYATNQWAPQKIHMDQAWGIYQPSLHVNVAIVDTGVDLTHPDLVNVFLRDGMGNIVGYNAQTPALPPSDGYGHGTHCAGIAVAEINNGTGIAGIAGWNPGIPGSTSWVRLMPVKVLDSHGSGTDFDVANGIIWATDNGAHVISMSLGANGTTFTLENAVAYAIGHNVTVVAAAGNNNSTTMFYPAASTGVISVAATNSGDEFAGFSNYGSWVKVAAPGVLIYSTMPTYPVTTGWGPDYGYLDGTSMATPHVAGEAALLKAMFPSLTNAQISAYITTNVDPLGTATGKTIAPGGGRINVYAAMLAGLAGSAEVVAVSVTPNPVAGGNSAVGTVTIGAPAPAGGTTVFLSSANTALATVPASITIAAGNSSATFNVTTTTVTVSSTVIITAVTAAEPHTTTLTINPPTVASISLNPASLTGGASSTATVTLTGPAPAGGTVVITTSNNAAAVVPATVTVTAGSTSTTFPITTSVVNANLNANITAKIGALSKSATLTIKAAILSSLALSSSSVVGGNAITGTVTFTGAVFSDRVVTLTSTNSAAHVPVSVLVPAGSNSAQFGINTDQVTSTVMGSVTASVGGVSKSVTLTMKPAMLTGLALSPTSVIGGNLVTGTVTLAAAVGINTTINLNSLNSAAHVPASVVVPPGASSVTFNITTDPVSSNSVGAITANYGTVTKSVNLTVKPAVFSSLTLSATSVYGGTSVTGTATFSTPVANNTTVTLSSANSAAHVPVSVVVMAGNSSATFTVTTDPVILNTSGAITATYGVTKSVNMTVKAPAFSSFTLTPNPVVGGNDVTGTVTMSGPVSVDTVVSLTNANPKATLPGASVTILAGSSSVSFTVTTVAVTGSTVSGAVTATVGAVTKNVSLKVSP